MLGLNRVCQIIGFSISFVLFVEGIWGQEAVVLDEIVAKVNQETITLTDLQQQLHMLKLSVGSESQNPGTLDRRFEDQKKGLLKDMIQRKMMLQKAEELGITEDMDGDVAKALETLRKEAGAPNLEMMDRALRERGTSLQEYRRDLRNKMVVDSLIQYQVFSRMTLLTPEIESFYQKNIKRYTESAEVELREILFLTEGENLEIQRKKAREVLAKLRSGDSFENLAKRYSEGPSASSGGNIGSFKEGSMAAALEEIGFNLKEGEFSGVIEMDYGLQIIKLVGKKPARRKPLEEVRSAIVNELYRIKSKPGIDMFLKELFQQSYIYVAPKYRAQFNLEGIPGSP